MRSEERELQRIRGIGKILARRFCESGYGTPACIAAATEEELRKIPGVNPRMISSMICEAASLSGPATTDPGLQGLAPQVARLRAAVAAVSLNVVSRIDVEKQGKGAKKLEKETQQLQQVLTALENTADRKMKRLAKVLAKGEKRVASLSERKPGRVAKGFRKTRKRLEEIYA